MIFTPNGTARSYADGLHLATTGVHDARVSEIFRFIPVLSGATAPDESPVLVLTVGSRRSRCRATVPAQKALAHAILTNVNFVKERCQSESAEKHLGRARSPA